MRRLRSGKYKQVRGRYKCAEGYCAIGVFFDILVTEGYGKWSNHLTYDDQQYFDSTYGEYTDVFNKLVNIDFGVVITMNDAQWLSFNEIANRVEAAMNESSRTK